MKLKLPMVLLLLGMSALCKSQTIVSAHVRISDYDPGITGVDLVLTNALVGISGDGTLSYLELRGNKNEFANFDYHDDQNAKSSPDFDVQYYGAFDRYKAGKVKSVCGVLINYYDEFDIHDQSGSLKSIGDIQVNYYNVFDIHDPRGMVKSIGNVSVTYFNKFDAEDLFGKIKTIKGNSRQIYVTK